MRPLSPDVLVAFGGCEVAIRSREQEISGALRATFRLMLGAGAVEPITLIEVRRAKVGYVATNSAGATARRARPRDILRWVRQELLESFIGARKDLLWMHGAAAARDGRAVLLPGQRGRGKSTLVTELCRVGWTFLTDDVLPLEPSTLSVLPFPRVPEVRGDPGREMDARWLLDVEKAVIQIDDQVERKTSPVAAIVLPFAMRSGGVALTSCSAAEAVIELAEGCWNFADHGAEAAATLSRLVTAAPTARLRFRSGGAAAARINEWAASGWRAL